MTGKKIVGKIHLWLGLASGLVVFIVAITGCIYAFQQEIQDMTQKYRYVVPQHKSMLSPSELRKISDKQLPGKHIHSVLYQGQERAAKAIYYSYEEKYYDFVYMNPYTGEVLKVKDENADFFRIVLDGHFYLWLPPNIGQPLVASATLVFLVLMISGLILWWPRKKSMVKQGFTIKWDARWRRKNHDLHRVLGFYCTWIAIIFAITGLVWGFEWFASGYYSIASGGKEMRPYREPFSDTTAVPIQADASPVDKIWQQMKKEHAGMAVIEMHFPETTHSSILAAMNPDPSTYWKMDYRYFDQYTLKELAVDHIWGRSDKARGADKLMRMNYDIHVGAILGLPGKVLAFFASLIIASLPVTGFLIWLGRRKKTAKAPLQRQKITVAKKEPAEVEYAEV